MCLTYHHTHLQTRVNLTSNRVASWYLTFKLISQRPDWAVYSKKGRHVCIASTCLLVNFWKASLYICFCTRKDRLTKKGKFVFDIPRKSAPFVPSRVGASKHETLTRAVLRNMQKWTFSRTVLGTCKLCMFLGLHFGMFLGFLGENVHVLCS